MKKEVKGESEIITWRWSEKSGGYDERKGIERWIEEEWLKKPLLTPSLYPFPISFLTFQLTLLLLVFYFYFIFNLKKHGISNFVILNFSTISNILLSKQKYITSNFV